MEEKNIQKQNRIFEGIVVSDKMDKTIVVKVDRMKSIKKYDKSIRLSKKYQVHDEKGLAKIGDSVRFAECRPYSKNKKWYLKEVIK